MKYLLDTNVCIRYLNGSSPEVLDNLRTVPASDVAICSIVKSELIYGAMRTTHPERTLARQKTFLQQFRSFPFDDRAAEHCGRIRAELSRIGRQIGPNDLMIASIALANGMVLVTHNTSEFERVTTLILEDWETPLTEEAP